MCCVDSMALCCYLAVRWRKAARGIAGERLLRDDIACCTEIARSW